MIEENIKPNHKLRKEKSRKDGKKGKESSRQSGRVWLVAYQQRKGSGWWHTNDRQRGGGRELKLVTRATVIEGARRDGAELAEAIKVAASLEGAIEEKLAGGAPGFSEDGEGSEPVSCKVEGGVGDALATAGVVDGVEAAITLREAEPIHQSFDSLRLGTRSCRVKE